jgi:hypothetical protein
MDFSCFQAASGTPGVPASGLFNSVSSVLLISFAGVAVASPLVRSRYRRWVARLMTFDQVSSRPAGWWERGTASLALEGVPATATLSDGSSPEARAAQTQRRITRATLVAGGVFSLFAVAVADVLGEAHTAVQRMVYGASAALFAVGPLLTNLPYRWSRLTLGAGVLAGTVGAIVLQNLDPEMASPGDIALGAIFLGVSYFVMFHRSLRGQVVPLFFAVGVAALVFFVPLNFIGAHASRCFESEAARSGVLALLIGTPFVGLGVWLGLRVLAGLIWLDERGWFSELSLASFLTLAQVALVMVAGTPAASSSSVNPIVALLPLVWMGVTAGAYVWALGVTPARAAAPSLLILRVFAQKGRQYALLDQVQQRWRYIGPVHQIGGPDLVALNVDLDECSMFLTGRLHELFLPEATNAEQLLSQLRMGADRDGRYRVNEVFCFNTAWRSTVRQLMQSSKVIVLDLRGFTPHREGTGYEIGLLAEGGLLPRVLAVRDAATAWPEVEALVRAAGGDPSHLAWVDEDGDGDVLFERLLGLAGDRRYRLPQSDGGVV